MFVSKGKPSYKATCLSLTAAAILQTHIAYSAESCEGTLSFQAPPSSTCIDDKTIILTTKTIIMIRMIILTNSVLLKLSAICQQLKHVRATHFLPQVLLIFRLVHLYPSSLMLAYRTEIVSIFHQQRTISRVLELIVK